MTKRHFSPSLALHAKGYGLSKIMDLLTAAASLLAFQSNPL